MNTVSRSAGTTVAAMAALIVGMSISRFAYTPILPVMLEAHALDHAGGALLASANMLGYLAGAIPAGLAWIRTRRLVSLALALIVNAAVLFAMALPLLTSAWACLRFVSGVSSAFIFVLASSLVLDLRNARAASWLFSSVGIGIAASGAILPFVYTIAPAWQSGWIVIGAVATMLSVVCVTLARESRPASTLTAPVPEAFPSLATIAVFAAYGIAGFSYVIPATFLVTIVAAEPSLHAYASATWVVVGIVAALAMPLWSPISKQFGKPAALAIALALLALGCVAPVLFANVAGALLAAFALGASFMAISMLAIGLIRDLDPSEGSARIGQGTAIFGIGQVAGPAFAGYTYGLTHSYATALVVAALALLVAVPVVFVARPSLVAEKS